MKRILLSIVAVCSVITINAQVDTLTEFFTGTPTIYSVGAAQGGGYVSGNNGYGDISKFQRFDAAHGISGNGMITDVLLSMPIIVDAGGTFKVQVVDFSGAALGTILAEETITIASVDTALTAFSIAEGSVIYNVAVALTTPVAITSTSDLAIGVLLPTTAGDTVALINNTDLDFADAATHTFEQWSNGSVNYIGDPNNWNLGIAFGIYPVASFGNIGILEHSLEANVYPNPASTVLNVNTSSAVTSISILSLDGKVLSTTNMNGTSTSVDVSTLTAGVYFYEIVAEDGNVIRNTFVKK